MTIIPWLLQGDISIQYLVSRDLLPLASSDRNPVVEQRDTLPPVSSEQLKEIRSRLGREGWGKRFLDEYNRQEGRWGGGWYGPKWIGSHYTLMTLMDLAIPPDNSIFREGLDHFIPKMWFNQGQVRKHMKQDLCIAGMMLNLMGYFSMDTPQMAEMIDYLLDHQFPDGGFNCEYYRGAKRSSVHTTLSVLKGFSHSIESGVSHRRGEMARAVTEAVDFLLRKHLFRSERTGEIFDKRMLYLSFPTRWFYDILKALEFFVQADIPFDPRMDEALDILCGKQRKDGTWPVQNKHAGRVYFDMEQTGKASRMNSYRALKVLKRYRPQQYKTVILQDYSL